MRQLNLLMKKSYVFLTLFALLLVFLVGLWLGVTVPRFITGGSDPRMLPSATVLRQVQTLSQLVTVKYVMEKIVVMEDAKWFGDNRVLLVANGIVKAGVNLENIKPEDLQVSEKRVVIRLPNPQITDAYLDDRQTRVVERTTGLLRTFDKNLEQNARQIAVDDIRRAARTAGLLKDAEDRAQSQLRNLFSQSGREVEFLPK